MTQKELIKHHLLSGGTISPIEALQKYGCFRLGARIWDLRHDGMDIENVGADEGQYAVYKLRVVPPKMPPAFAAKPMVSEQPQLF